MKKTKKTEKTETTDSSVSFRWMVMPDLSAVIQIEKESFDHPWSQEEFLACLRSRNCIGMVALCDSKVVGFMIYELVNKRVHLISVAVTTAFRRRGIGRMMMDKLKNKLSAQYRTQVSLEVRETNLAAQLFFRSCQFQATSVLRDFYEQTQEDAYQMQYRMPFNTVPVPSTPNKTVAKAKVEKE